MNTTARGQFVSDYTLVVDNDFEAYTQVKELIESTNGNPDQLELVKESLQSQFERYINQLADESEERGVEVGANLLRQLLNGWGEAWYDIARHYINNFNELN